MTGKSIDYEDILRRWKRTPEQAANDLERYLLRQELPDPGSVARAVVILRSNLEPVAFSRWRSEGHVRGNKYLWCGTCQNCGKITVAFEGPAARCEWCGAHMDSEIPCKP